jgi:hypothetical protein
MKFLDNGSVIKKGHSKPSRMSVSRKVMKCWCRPENVLETVCQFECVNENVQHITSVKFDISEIRTRWVPHECCNNRKQIHMEGCQQTVTLWAKALFLISHDHLSWIIHYDPTAIKCLKTQKPTSTKYIFHGTFIWKEFFESKHIILQHWVPQMQTVIGEYCTKTLKSVLQNAIQGENTKKKTKLLMKLWCLLQDSAWPHTTQVVMLVLADIGGHQ